MKEILYVEDNLDIAQAVQMILEKEGYSVKIAGTGTEGIMSALRNQYDLILLDLMLPDMSGFEVFATLRNKINTKFILVSAIPISDERLQHLLSEGIKDYIMKPFAKNEFVVRINNIIEA